MNSLLRVVELIQRIDRDAERPTTIRGFVLLLGVRGPDQSGPDQSGPDRSGPDRSGSIVET